MLCPIFLSTAHTAGKLQGAAGFQWLWHVNQTQTFKPQLPTDSAVKLLGLTEPLGLENPSKIIWSNHTPATNVTHYTTSLSTTSCPACRP